MEKIRIGILDYKTENIGDWIQSLATLQYLPYINFLYKRDTGIKNKYDNSLLIFNAWTTDFIDFNRLNNIDKKLILSLHLANYYKRNKKMIYDNKNGRFLDFSKKFSDLKKLKIKIGARDMYTYDLLKKNKIDTYLSYCLTLTLQTDIIKKEDRKNIIFCDTKKIKDLNNFLPRHILEKYIYVQHSSKKYKKLSFKENIYKCIELLNLYKNAKLVITTRLHCALPCLAFRTPVIYISNKEDKRINNTYIDLFEYFVDIRDLSKLKKINYQNIYEIKENQKVKQICNNIEKIIFNFLENNEIKYIKDNFDNVEGKIKL